MENNLYLDLSNLLLKHFSYLTETTMFYRNIFVALLGIGIVSLFVAIINYVEKEDNRSIYFAATLSWIVVIAGCVWYLENDDDKNEQQIQV